MTDLILITAIVISVLVLGYWLVKLTGNIFAFIFAVVAVVLFVEPGQREQRLHDLCTRMYKQ